MALLDAQAASGDLTLEAADVAGDTVAYYKKQQLMVVNGGASPVTVTVGSHAVDSPPLGPSDLEVEVGAGKTRLIDISNRLFSNDNVVDWSYSAVTDVSVAVLTF